MPKVQAKTYIFIAIVTQNNEELASAEVLVVDLGVGVQVVVEVATVRLNVKTMNVVRMVLVKLVVTMRSSCILFTPID